MPASDTAKLIAALTLKDGFTGPLKNANKALGQFDANLTKTQSRANLAGQQIGTGIKNGVKLAAVGIGILGTQVVAGLNQLSQLEQATTATNAALVSTKGVSGETAASIRGLAEQYENLNAIVDDKVIQSGENVLLTFTNIRKEAFEPALAAALDLSTAMGTDLQTAIVQVGKALNDPAKGFTALRRVGIQFTADQEKQIKALQASGDLLGAQKIIIAELGTEFGGRFQAQGRTATGTIAGIGDAVEDLQKAIATGLFPVIQTLLPRIRDTLANPAFIRGATELGNKIADLFSDENITAGASVLEGLFRTAQKVAPAIEKAAVVTGQVITTAVNLFKSLPPEIQSLAVAGLAINKLTGGLVTNLAGGLISAVISSFKGLMNVTAASVVVNGPVAGGLPGGAGAAAGGGGLLATAGSVAVPVTILAIGAQAATDLANADIAGKGLTGKFSTPGSGILPFGIEASLNNIATAIGLLNQTEKRQAARNPAEFTADRHFTALDEGFDNTAAALRTADRHLGGVDAALDSNTNATRAQTAAAKALTLAEIKGTISADRIARGLTGPFKRSTSLAPRINFLNQNQAGSKDVSVSHAIALGFERGATPLFRKTDQIPRAIKALQRDQKQLAAHGDTKNAALVGGDIRRLKAELDRRLVGVKIAVQKIPPPRLAVTVNNKTSLNLNGRLLDSDIGRFHSVFDTTGNHGK